MSQQEKNEINLVMGRNNLFCFIHKLVKKNEINLVFGRNNLFLFYTYVVKENRQSIQNKSAIHY